MWRRPRLVTADTRRPGPRPGGIARRRGAFAPDPAAMPEMGRTLGRQRHGGAPRGGVPVARDGPCLASVASRPTSATCFKAGASRRSAAPRFGVGCKNRPGAEGANAQAATRGKAGYELAVPRKRHAAGLFDIVNRGSTASRRLASRAEDACTCDACPGRSAARSHKGAYARLRGLCGVMRWTHPDRTVPHTTSATVPAQRCTVPR